ncbi:MAG: hypothetical protein IVW55_12805 [Chloroflexi bacterium]|nr:hypothetical protein [Chloroflexota bacterium]
MQELEKRIAQLRLLLADIQGKQAHLSVMESQYKSQLTRIVEFAVYRDGDVANALSLMAEVQGKLDDVLHSTSHLKMIDDKATIELEVLLLTKRVSEARAQLAELEARRQELSGKLSNLPKHPTPLTPAESSQTADIPLITEEVANIAQEITRLNNLIIDASERAARTIQPSTPGEKL